MKIDVLGTDAQMASLLPEWSALYERSGHNLFQNPQWHRMWWDKIGFRDGWVPHIVVARRRDRVVAVASLAISRSRGIRCLEWAGASFFDYPEILADPDVDVLSFWQSIRQFGGYDVARLRDVRSDGSSVPALRVLAREADDTTRVYAIELNHGTGADWFSTLSKRSRDNHLASLRRLQRAGEVSMQVAGAPDEVGRMIGELVEQKLAWAAARSVDTTMAERDVQGFLEELALQALADGNLHLSALRCGDRSVSTHLGFVSNDGYYYYLPSYDGAFAAMSPGRVHLVQLVMWAVDNGYHRFDFLRGEDRYKASLGQHARELRHYVFTRGAVGRLALCVAALRQRFGQMSLQASVT
jgi:CelD/BcsL family acetyltransferase involved in cellulose biosynthesis